MNPQAEKSEKGLCVVRVQKHCIPVLGPVDESQWKVQARDPLSAITEVEG